MSEVYCEKCQAWTNGKGGNCFISRCPFDLDIDTEKMKKLISLPPPNRIDEITMSLIQKLAEKRDEMVLAELKKAGYECETWEDVMRLSHRCEIIHKGDLRVLTVDEKTVCSWREIYSIEINGNCITVTAGK